MKVMYACDNHYVWLMGISAISLLENNKGLEALEIYLLGERISEENKSVLANIAERYGRRVEVIDVPALSIPPSLVSSRWPLAAFVRLFSSVVLPEDVDRILYLDCDTIVCGDLSELESVPFHGHMALGVKDCISGVYKRNAGLDANSAYLNAGVILFDMKALRRESLCAGIERYMKKHEQTIYYADQDVLNGLFGGRLGELPPKYNVMTIEAVHTYDEIKRLRRPTNYYGREELEKAVAAPAIIHYTANLLVVRPWFSNTDHPFAGEFRRYMEMSPWKDRKLGDMAFDSWTEKAVAALMRLPKRLAYDALGLIHAELRPRYMRMRAK